MSNRVEWLGFRSGKPCIEIDRWAIEELYVPEMGSLNEYQTSFGVEVEGWMNEEVYLTVTDRGQGKSWRFRYIPDSGQQIRFDRCVIGGRGKARKRR